MIPSLLLLAGCPHPDSGAAKASDTSSVDTGEVDTHAESAESSDSMETAPPDSDTDAETGETGETGDTGAAPPPCDRTRPWMFVDAGIQQTCGIHDDGCAECWGIGEEENSRGWDTGDYHWQGEDQPPPESFVMLDMLRDTEGLSWSPHTCGIITDGSAVCWGENSYHQCEIPAGTYKDVAVSVSTTWTVTTESAVGILGFSAESPDDTGVRSVEVGSYALLLGADGALAGWDTWGAPNTTEVPDGAFIAVDVSRVYGCALTTLGEVECWYYWDPDAWATSLLSTEAPAGPFVDICVSNYSSACALDAAGQVTCWGDDAMPGSLKDYPTDVTFTQIACGYAHASGVTTDGGIECWGYDWHGETVVPT